MSTVMDPARPLANGYKALNPIAILSGWPNGKLDASILAITQRGLKMNLQSARKFKALVNKAIVDGISLSTTGDYRSFEQQEQLLFQRYDKGFFPARGDYNTYMGTTWSLKPGMAQAASPGTSNHGTGRARDFAEMLNGDTIPDALSLKTRQWLAQWAPKFGICFEVPKEDWHGTDYAGDTIPKAVLDFESGGGSNPGDPGHVPAFDPNNGMFSLYPLDPAKAKIYYTEPNMHSDLVAYAQGVLRCKLQYVLVADGFFGPKTRDFIVWFQSTHGLTADGIVGKMTWAALDRLAVA